MGLLTMSGCRISSARSLTGERHETLVERAALAVPRARGRAGARGRTGRRPDAQARRRPQRDAGRGSAGLLGARVLDDLRRLAAVTLLLQPRAVRSAQGVRVGGD